jgi:hypothetical protein
MVANVSYTPLDSSFFGYIRSKIGLDSFAQDILDHIIPNRTSSLRSKLSRISFSETTASTF